MPRISLQAQCQNSYSGAHLAWVEEPKEAATLSRVIMYYQRTQPVWLGLHYLRQVRGRGYPWGRGQRGCAPDPVSCSEPGLALDPRGEIQ